MGSRVPEGVGSPSWVCWFIIVRPTHPASVIPAGRAPHKRHAVFHVVGEGERLVATDDAPKHAHGAFLDVRAFKFKMNDIVAHVGIPAARRMQ